MRSITFVTGSMGKFQEVAEMLNTTIEQSDLVVDEIQSLDLEDIARHKAETAFKMLRKPLFVDDSGLAVTAWHKFPGPFVKHIQQAGGMELFLDMMQHTTNREAFFQTVIAYHDGSEVHTFEGKVKGHITHNIRGSKGWGFDGIFIPDGHSKTYAEMEFAEKNSFSHRTIAVMLFKKYLVNNLC